MKEAYGGIFNLAFLIVFLVIAIGILGLTFSYTKAFKMNDYVINAIEEYQGQIDNEQFKAKIERLADSLGYNPDIHCPTDYTAYDNYFCYRKNGPYETTIRGKKYKYSIFSIITQFDIYFPIVESMMHIHFFQVRGETREIWERY